MLDRTARQAGIIREISPLTHLVLATFIWAAGVSFPVWVGLPAYHQARGGASWPAAEGRIHSSEIKDGYNQKGTLYYFDFSYKALEKRHSSKRRIDSSSSEET